MDKDLTRQWFKGYLPEGYYYTNKNGVEYIHSSQELNNCDFLDGIVILGKVPKFAEIVKLQKQKEKD